MTVRTSVAFDPATAARLERLAKRWGVSKSETLRRALESAEIAAAKPSLGSSQPTTETHKEGKLNDFTGDIDCLLAAPAAAPQMTPERIKQILEETP
jgi:hypothetical protein